MSVGALVMSVSTIVVAANAQLLRGVNLRPERAVRPAERAPQAA
jgi:Cu2+-exporting ATPase